MTLKAGIEEDMKSAMRAGDKARLGVIRMLLAAIRQREIDERTASTDASVLQTIEKLIKQRRESATQYAQAGRAELEARELAEIEVLQAYLPEPLTPAELEVLIDECIAASGATGIRDMGKVMNAIRDRVQGRADMAAVSAEVKRRLTAGQASS